MLLARNNVERINQATHNSMVSELKSELSELLFIDPFYIVLGQLTAKVVLTLP